MADKPLPPPEDTPSWMAEGYHGPAGTEGPPSSLENTLDMALLLIVPVVAVALIWGAVTVARIYHDEGFEIREVAGYLAATLGAGLGAFALVCAGAEYL